MTGWDTVGISPDGREAFLAQRKTRYPLPKMQAEIEHARDRIETASSRCVRGRDEVTIPTQTLADMSRIVNLALELCDQLRAV